MSKVYLGESVYAEFDGYGIWLTTRTPNNGYAEDPHKIYLEPTVFFALNEWVKSLSKPPAAASGDGD